MAYTYTPLYGIGGAADCAYWIRRVSGVARILGRRFETTLHAGMCVYMCVCVCVCVYVCVCVCGVCMCVYWAGGSKRPSTLLYTHTYIHTHTHIHIHTHTHTHTHTPIPLLLCHMSLTPIKPTYYILKRLLNPLIRRGGAYIGLQPEGVQGHGSQCGYHGGWVEQARWSLM
jgi:hypothetical protein